MDSKLPRLNRGGSPAPAILTFMGMAGGAYYLYKSIAGNPSRVADSKPDSIANKHLEKAEANIKYQDSLISRMQRVAQDDPRTKDLQPKDYQPKDDQPKDYQSKNCQPKDWQPKMSKDSSEK